MWERAAPARRSSMTILLTWREGILNSNMAARLGLFPRFLEQNRRIWSVCNTRLSLLSSGQHKLSWMQEIREFSDDIPAKPKRPLTSFLQFTSEQRPKLLATEPNLSVTEVTKRLGAIWKDMPDDEKEVYRLEFESRKEKYMAEMEDFRSRLTDEQLDTMAEMDRKKRETRAKRRHRSEMKKLNKPKRPPTGYSLFIKAHFNEQAVGGRTREEINAHFKEAAAVWRSLPEYEKQQYHEEASLLSETYREELDEWKKKMEEGTST